MALRLVAAALFASVVGLQREQHGKPAGLRTHMLVAVGSALFAVIAVESGLDSSDMSRVIQGLVTGIGFLGAGAILKREQERDIKGLTTAAGIWMVAGVGMAAGLGHYVLALLATALAWAILALLGSLERPNGHHGG